MCGIVGAVGSRNIVPVLVEGLKRLEYRGYDSCGVAVLQDGQLRRSRSTQRVAELGHQTEQDGIDSTVEMGGCEGMPLLEAALVKRGYGSSLIEGAMYRNALRFFSDVLK